jgi:hypothetical protein
LAPLRELRVACVLDADRHAALNRAGKNYWDLYLREMLDEMGLRADEIGPAALGDPAQLDRYAAILMGDVDAGNIPGADEHLERWVREGGTLVGTSTAGLDALFGNRPRGLIRQPQDEYSIAATLSLAAHPLTRDIHAPHHPEQRLLAFSDARDVRPERSFELARLHDPTGRDLGCAAVTVRSLGAGRAAYFAFSLPQTLWVLHQGRPVDGDRDGDGYLRRSDAIPIRPHSIEVAYADELLALLVNLIAARPFAFIDPLPPMAGGRDIPDALFHWGGDDEGAADGIQLAASNWMRSRELPYHINAMPRKDGTFGLSAADAEKIRANGHEISIHYNFMDNFAKGAAFTREDVLAQAEAFRRQFGADPVCTVNHWLRWTGYTEPARWMREAGGRADNSFAHSGSPPLNPTNLLGFSFGTAFPFWFYDDARGGNARIDFLEMPINAYEVGYLDKDRVDFASVRKVVDHAARYRATMNMFHHPHFIAAYPSTRAAIEEGLRYARQRGVRSLHMGNDELYRWWRARSEARVERVASSGDQVEVESDASVEIVVKIPLGSRMLGGVTIDGSRPASAFRVEERFGRCWALAVVPAGRHRATFWLR